MNISSSDIEFVLRCSRGKGSRGHPDRGLTEGRFSEQDEKLIKALKWQLNDKFANANIYCVRLNYMYDRKSMRDII